MIITPCPHGLEDVLGKSIGYRTPGVHISQIYSDLYQRLEPKRFTGGVPDPVRLEAGLSFENIIEQELAKRLSIFRPGEVVSEEGVILSPDSILVNGTVKVAEFKLTWLSSSEMPTEECESLPPKFSKYIVQCMAYTFVLGLEDARLYIYFVNSDYRPPTPSLKAYDLHFNRRELEDNWSMLMRHGAEMGIIKHGKVVEQSV